MDATKINELRHTLERNLLKNVLIRLDYSGIDDIQKAISNNEQFFGLHFEVYTRGKANNASLDLTNVDDIAKTLSIPVREIKSETVHTYSGWRGEQQDDVKLSITSYYTTLNVACRYYKTIDEYLAFIKELIVMMYGIFSFMDIKRIGIRKLGGDTFKSINQMFQVYKRELFFGQDIDSSAKFLQREYTDRYAFADGSMKVNYSRNYRLRVVDGQDNYQAMLDIDEYVDESNISKRHNVKDDSMKVLEFINTNIDEVFFNSVTKEYINKKGKYE